MIWLALAIVAAGPLLWRARRCVEEGRPERFVALIVVVLLIESVLYPTQAETPVGPFRIPFAGGGVRTIDFLVVLGVVGRATVRPLPQQLRGTAVLWVLAFVWLATAAVRGVLAGHTINIVLFSTMSVLGMFGSCLLVAGCEPAKLAALLRGRFVIPLGALALLLIPNTASEPDAGWFGTDLGLISVDTASVFLSLGMFVLLAEWSSRHRHRWVMWAALPLLATPFVTEQRATLLHLGATVLVVGWAMTRREWRINIQLPRIQLLWGALAGIAVLMVVLMVQLSGEEGSLPFADYYEETFARERQQQSAQARVEGFGVGMDEWRAAPVFGYGLGHTYDIVRPGGVGFRQPATFDNVPLDLLVRTGAVGLVLVVGALAATVRDGLTVWRRHTSGTVSGLAIAAVAVIVGLSVKAVFESILEKGKLALLLGLAAGVIAAAARELRAAGERPPHRLSDRAGEAQWT